MIKYLFIYLVIAIIGLITIDSSTIVMATFIYFFGMALVFIINTKDKRNIKYIIKIYQIVYVIGLTYICACYYYMKSHSYEYLLAWDIYNYFMPVTESFLGYDSLVSAEIENWKDFNFFSRYQSGYFGYLIPFAYFSSYLNANLYVGMQLSTLLTTAFSSVVIFKLLLVNNIEPKKAYKYTIIICLFSVLFFYSTQLLRDISIMFLYLLSIYLTFKKEFSIIQVCKIFILIVLCCTLRIESGLFLFILLPIYFLLTIQGSRKNNTAILVGSVVALISIVLLTAYSNNIIAVLSANSEFYLESDKGEGIIGSLQTIPIIGSVLSILYNAIQPLPFWLKYETPTVDFRPEMFNIMTFPLSLSSLFDWIVLFFIFSSLINKSTRIRISKNISKPLLYHIYVGFFYLWVQSAVIDKRRLMGYYVIFYILFYIIYTNLRSRERQQIFFFAFISYGFLQFLTLFYKL